MSIAIVMEAGELKQTSNTHHRVIGVIKTVKVIQNVCMLDTGRKREDGVG